MYFKLKSCVNFCPQSLAPDFKGYTCVINNPISVYIYMYVGGLLDNVEQHANIDHNYDVDNHVNLGLATV